jgi:hypothetical protein
MHNTGMHENALSQDPQALELASVAARWVVEEGLRPSEAKQRAAEHLGLRGRVRWPDEAMMDAAVREHIAVFCPESQAQDLLALRALALRWMTRLAAFDPHVSGAVWHGTATRHNDVFLQLFLDDEKAVEWLLMERRVTYHPGSAKGWRGEMVPVLTVQDADEALGPVLVHLMLHATDDVRGALKPDAMGRAPRGNTAALRHLMENMG